MRKSKQAGFAPVETVLVLIVIAIIAFTAWYVFNSKSKTDSTLSNAALTQSEVAKNSDKTKSSSPTPTKTTAPQVVTTKTDTKGNKYLADSNGKTLYTYGGDTKGVSNCSGSCLTDWPVYAATSSSTSLPANVTIIKRSDGGSQYAYKGLALYYFTGDTKAGEVTGDGVSNFHLATP